MAGSTAKMIDASQTPPPASTQEPLEEATIGGHRERRNSSPNRHSDLVRDQAIIGPIERKIASYRPGEELGAPPTNPFGRLDRALLTCFENDDLKND